MTGDEFSDFLDQMGWNNLQAAIALELGRNTVTRYKAKGAPKSIDLACAALAFGLPPLSQSRGEEIAVSRTKLLELQELAANLAG